MESVQIPERSGKWKAHQALVSFRSMIVKGYDELFRVTRLTAALHGLNQENGLR
jgi:hypothetical protein